MDKQHKVKDWSELPIMLSTTETAKLLGYGAFRVRELCRHKHIPCIRLGRAFRIPRDSLRIWLEHQVQVKERE